MNKRAIITGVTGQDGSYLSELLLSKGYEVYGVVRRSSTLNRKNIDHLNKEEDNSHFKLIYGDLTDANVISKIVREIKPDEIYNLGAQSHVRVSFDIPVYTTDSIALGTLRLLEAIRQENSQIKFYQASSSEMYGEVLEIPQTENTPFNPRSPYACSKVFAHQITKLYRDSYGLFNCCGILFNHESPRRGDTFVSKKIVKAVVQIKLEEQKNLLLGNLDAKRDWGYAPEYVEAMWKMLQYEQPDDFVIATGETHTVKEFVEEAFNQVGLNWKDYVKIDSKYYRPSEVNLLQGDYSKAKEKLGWEPKVKFKQLVKLMMDAEIKEFL